MVYPEVETETGAYDYDRHLDNAFLADVSPRIVHRVASILGPDVVCWRTEFFRKYPGDAGTQWHQTHYFGSTDGAHHLTCPQGSGFPAVLTAWIAFTDATVENSCMQFIPSTQGTLHYDESKEMHDPHYKEDQSSTRCGFYGYDWRETQIDPDWEPDETKAVSVPCRAGEFLLFWETVLHASSSGKNSGIRFAFCSNMRPCVRGVNEIAAFGGRFSLEKYGVVLIFGRTEYTHNRVRTHTTQGKPFVKCNPR